MTYFGDVQFTPNAKILGFFFKKLQHLASNVPSLISSSFLHVKEIQLFFLQFSKIFEIILASL